VGEIGESRVAVTATPGVGPTAPVLQEIADHERQVVLALVAEPPSDLAHPSSSAGAPRQPIPCRHAHPAVHYGFVSPSPPPPPLPPTDHNHRDDSSSSWRYLTAIISKARHTEKFPESLGI